MDKPAAYIHRGFDRVEFFDFPDLNSLNQGILKLKQEGREKISLHVPGVRPSWFNYSGVTCFFLSEDKEKRDLSFKLLEDTLQLAKELKACHAVCHLTYGPTDSKDNALAHGLASDSTARMAALSQTYGVSLDIEFAAYTDSFNLPADFIEAITPHPELGICLDTGHAFLGAQKRSRDFYNDVKILAPRIRSMHLWNAIDNDTNKILGHIPLHPSQANNTQYIDFTRVFNILATAKCDPKVIFEYPLSQITPEIQAGYDWIETIITASKGQSKQ